MLKAQLKQTKMDRRSPSPFMGAFNLDPTKCFASFRSLTMQGDRFVPVLSPLGDCIACVKCVCVDPSVISSAGRNLRSLTFVRLCENPSMLRVASARTGCGVSKIKYLTVRPELSRRAPIEFSQSLAQREKSFFTYCTMRFN